jgi:hypothetical protein
MIVPLASLESEHSEEAVTRHEGNGSAANQISLRVSVLSVVNLLGDFCAFSRPI